MIPKTLSRCCSTRLMLVLPSVQLWSDIVSHRSLSSTPYPYWSFFNFEHQLLVSFAWLSFHTWMEDIFQHPMVVQNVRLIERRIFPRDSRRQGLRPAVRQRPYGTPLTANPLYAGIYFPSRRTPGWELNIGLHLDFRSGIQEHFPVNSISIRLWPIHGFSRCSAPDLSYPHRDTSGEHVSGELDFHWFPVDQ